MTDMNTSGPAGAIPWVYSNQASIWNSKEEQGVPFLSFQALEALGFVANGFSTRLGGASTGKFATMNFSYTRGDDPEHVLENFRRMGAALGVDEKRMVVSFQTHTTNIRQVTAADAGKGVILDRDYRDVDGLICDVPGITLVTFYADCVPLYFVDTKNRVIGLSHSGWRGTVNRMGRSTVEAMNKAYGTRPEDLIACIGPSICKDCFEVGEEVVEEFKHAFRESHHDELWTANGKPGKFQLDLWRANELILKEAGIPESQIVTTNICTRCNSDYLFSHRRAGEQRGNVAAFLGIREV